MFQSSCPNSCSLELSLMEVFSHQRFPPESVLVSFVTTHWSLRSPARPRLPPSHAAQCLVNFLPAILNNFPPFHPRKINQPPSPTTPNPFHSPKQWINRPSKFIPVLMDRPAKTILMAPTTLHFSSERSSYTKFMWICKWVYEEIQREITIDINHFRSNVYLNFLFINVNCVQL